MTTSPATPPDVPGLTDATSGDLALAAAAIGPLARYGGLLRAALAGIYAERRTHAAHDEDADEAGEAACLICGCTENTPCPGGCHWTDAGGMEADICSACQPILETVAQATCDSWRAAIPGRGRRMRRYDQLTTAKQNGWQAAVITAALSLPLADRRPPHRAGNRP